MEYESDMSEARNLSQNAWGRLVSTHILFPNCDLTSDSFMFGRATSRFHNNKYASQIKTALLVSVSKRHFKITKDLSQFGGPAFIEDLSRNGIFINGEKIQRNVKRILEHGDKISILHPTFQAFRYCEMNRPSLNNSLEQNENMPDDKEDDDDVLVQMMSRLCPHLSDDETED